MFTDDGSGKEDRDFDPRNKDLFDRSIRLQIPKMTAMSRVTVGQPLGNVPELRRALGFPSTKKSSNKSNRAFVTTKNKQTKTNKQKKKTEKKDRKKKTERQKDRKKSEKHSDPSTKI